MQRAGIPATTTPEDFGYRMRYRLIPTRRTRAAVAFLVSLPLLDAWSTLQAGHPTVMLLGIVPIVTALALWALLE